MDIKNFKAGKLQKGYKYQYFLPEQINHQFVISDIKLQEKLEIASFRLGEVNSFGKFIPNLDLFIKSYVTKEAVTSSRIEGTRTNMQDAFVAEDDVNPEFRDDWKEVNCYIEALNYSLKRLDKLPLSNRLLKEAHQILLSNVRGKTKNPGQFRTSQNWLGGAVINDAIFIPPAAQYVEDLMSDLEKFLHNDEIIVPHLVRVAIAHYQFETIHPFLDGNGRIGRFLIGLYLVSVGLLDQPILYISDFFEKNKSLYYDKLTFARTKNDMIGWVIFFLEGVIQTSQNATKSMQEIVALRDKITLKKIPSLGRKTSKAQEFLDVLFTNPVLSAKDVGQKLSLSAKASNDMISDFVKLKILREITNQKRNRLFVFDDYLKILEK